jgi:hypothetical protein
MSTIWHHFLYTTLNSQRSELRLLTIREPFNQAVSIDCDIQTFELSHAPRFDALSYVWGDQSLAKEIKVLRLFATSYCKLVRSFGETTRIQGLQMGMDRRGVHQPG